MWRRQPPTWSPVTAGMIWAAASEMVRGSPRGTPAGASPVARLAEQLARELGIDKVAPTGSGTDALTMAIAGSAIGRPRVALPAWGCPDLATAADGADARVLLYDIDPRTLSPDLDSLRRAASRGIDAIVVASFFGVPSDLDAVGRIANDAGALVIDDAAQGIGGSWRGRPLGVQGDLGILSFGRGKGRIGGSGGALLVSSERGRAALERLQPAPSSITSGFRQLAVLAGIGLLSHPMLFRIPASLPFLRIGESIYHPARPLQAMSPIAAATLCVGTMAAHREAEARGSPSPRSLVGRAATGPPGRGDGRAAAGRHARMAPISDRDLGGAGQPVGEPRPSRAWNDASVSDSTC
jgi:hypothetical protein